MYSLIMRNQRHASAFMPEQTVVIAAQRIDAPQNKKCIQLAEKRNMSEKAIFSNP
jgi:hypothetical protein